MTLSACRGRAKVGPRPREGRQAKQCPRWHSEAGRRVLKKGWECGPSSPDYALHSLAQLSPSFISTACTCARTHTHTQVPNHTHTHTYIPPSPQPHTTHGSLPCNLPLTQPTTLTHAAYNTHAIPRDLQCRALFGSFRRLTGIMTHLSLDPHSPVSWDQTRDLLTAGHVFHLAREDA